MKVKPYIILNTSRKHVNYEEDKNKVPDKTGGDRPREHCILILDVVRLVHGYFIFVFLIINMLS
jgi:hypothetical protein